MFGMKRNYYFVVFSLIFLFPVFTSTFLIATPSNIDEELIIKNSGISKNGINQSVTYQLEINYSLTHTDAVDDQTYHLNIARFTSRNTNYSLTPPYQEGTLLYNSSSGFDNILWDYKDKFNNTYDSFNATLLGASDTIHYSIKYELTLNEVYFDPITDSDMGIYNTSAEIFDLYCNNSEPYYNITDPDLMNAATNEVGITAGDNYVEKAKKIYDFVLNRLIYNGNLPAGEKGASWAYDNKEGDCSEFSSLMVTLLRIRGIPARKVTGLVISNDPAYRPSVGDVLTFDESYDGPTQTKSSTNGFMGHAWVEYYVPNIGWIVSDPTWGQGGDYTYFNKLDYLHLSSNIGAWIYFNPGFNYSEYPYMPAPGYSDPGGVDSTDFNYALTAKFTVTNVNLVALPEFPWLLLIIILGIAAVAIIAIVIIAKRRS
jgi:transglutaminase-like putative cysteine protease